MPDLVQGKHYMFWRSGNITYMNCPVATCVYRLKTTHELDDIFYYNTLTDNVITYEDEFYQDMSLHLYMAHLTKGEKLNPDGTLYDEPVGKVPVV